MKKTTRIILAASLLFVSLTSLAQKGERGEVLYHVFQRSFYDSNGDKQGDLNGLKQQLPYLQDLGITSILLLPLYDADCYHNYFANDFEKIDPEFGTMADYISLVKEIHRRGMKVYMDMESQYVAEKHLWWKDAVGNPKSPYSNYILFEDAAHQVPSTFVFDLRQLNSYDGKFVKVTTVNLRDPDVLDYNKKLFGYFVDPNKDGKFDDGVDGFRLDHAMDHLDGKAALADLFVHFWKPLMLHIKGINPKLKNVAEQSEWKDYGFSYFTNAAVDRMFGFGLQQALLSFDKQELIRNADTILAKCPAGKDQIIFLENHDMDRFASLEPNPQKQRQAAALMLLIGGTPSIYYGQEIGMMGKIGNWGNTDGNDIPRRAAFDWYASGAGKGTAKWYEGTGGWSENSGLFPHDGISVEEQQKDSNSLFNHYKRIIRLKQANPALSTGTYSHAVNDNNSVFSFYRTSQNRKVLVVANLSGVAQKAVLQDRYKSYRILYGQSSVQDNTLELKPYEVVVFEVR